MMDDKAMEEAMAQLDSFQSACTHCGICSEGCATYQATGWEHESPRGRLHLAAQFLHGRIHPQSEALSTFDRCLGCRACEPLCPHEVPYSKVRQTVQELRRELGAKPAASMDRRTYRQWISFAGRISSPMWRRFGAGWLRVPTIGIGSEGSYLNKAAKAKKGGRVLVVCCMQDLFQHRALSQVLDFNERLGCPLEVDPKQPCCGAIFDRLVQGGEESISYPKEQRRAAELQNQTRERFLKWLPADALFLSRMCHSFASPPDGISSDLYVWIENLLEKEGVRLELPAPKKVYYQPYCRSPKGKGDSVLGLLQRIRNLSVQEVKFPHVCCGGYCGEALLHPQSAESHVQLKAAHLPLGATLVVASPDCWGAFKMGALDKSLHICCPFELLNLCLSV